MPLQLAAAVHAGIEVISRPFSLGTIPRNITIRIPERLPSRYAKIALKFVTKFL